MGERVNVLSASVSYSA